MAVGGISEITLTFKKSTITSNLKSNETHLNLIRAPIPQKPYMSPGHKLKPLPQGSGRLRQPLEALLYFLWTILNKLAIAQIQSDTYGEKKGS